MHQKAARNCTFEYVEEQPIFPTFSCFKGKEKSAISDDAIPAKAGCVKTMCLQKKSDGSRWVVSEIMNNRP